MNSEIQALTQRIDDLEYKLNQFKRPDHYLFERHIELADGVHISIKATTGTQIGTSSSQKLAFLGATPIAQQSAVTAPSGGGSGSTNAVDISARTAINQIIAVLQAFGLTS